MFYKLLGMLTWKAIRFYLHQKVPRKRVGLALFVGIAAVAGLAVLRDRQDVV